LAISLLNAVLLDAGIWLLCLIALLSFARLSITHPATIYLAFHGLLFSGRAIAILNGATTLFSGRNTAAVTHAEIARALMLADLGLVAMTSAWILAAHKPIRVMGVARPLQLRIIRAVCAVAIPVGCMAMLLWSRVPGLVAHEIPGPWGASNWIVIAQTWAGLSLLALIYWYGFRPIFTIPMAIYLALVIYQGAFRFRLLVPLILLVQIYIDRRTRRWPTLSSAVLLIVCGLLFFPLKEIGQKLQSGESMWNVWDDARAEIADVVRGNHPDQVILDEFASTLTLADQYGKLFLGRTYSGLITVAVPRQWWPEKPGLADYEKEISTRSRPMAEDGMVTTMLGEFYLNFSYVGIVVLSFTFAYLTGRWFKAAYQREYFSLARFVYLLVTCNLIQVYRDGLISLFVFVVINMMPLTVIALLHLTSRPPQQSLYRYPILSTPRVRERARDRAAEQPVSQP
jgi:hypothetical protein